MSLSIKQSLQKDVFLSDEKLLSCIQTRKQHGGGGLSKKSKHPSYLCITVTLEKPIQIKIHLIKRAERSGEAIKRKQSFLLNDLKSVDGKQTSKDTPEFELQFDKVYKWIAESREDKEAFIKSLWKLSLKHLERRPTFLNVQRGILDEMESDDLGIRLPGQMTDGAVTLSHASSGDVGDYQVLTNKEEADLASLMGECDVAISQANVFAEQLSNELSVLDGANVYSIMASEDHIVQLMKLLDSGIDQAVMIEDRLISYEFIIKSVKTQMEIIRDKDSMIRIQEYNYQQLESELTDVVTKLDLSHNHQKALLDGDLSSPDGIADCTAAAKALASCLQASIPTALVTMDAVKEQHKRYEKLKASFSKKLSHHLNNLFVHRGNIAVDSLTHVVVDFRMHTLQKHHAELLPYADLMTWLAAADGAMFENLKMVYLNAFQKLYQTEIGDFIENAQLRVPAKGEKKAGTHIDLNGSSSSLPSAVVKDSTAIDDKGLRIAFAQVCSRLLSEIAPMCIGEQNFCILFFNFNRSNSEDQLAKEKLSQDIRKLLTDLFARLDQDLQSFVMYAHKQDPYYSLCLLVQLSLHMSRIDPSCFLVKILGNCLVTVKRNCDSFIKSLINAYKETKVNKKNRCGVISFVHDFESFAEQAELIFHGSDRRRDLDQAYKLLVESIFEEVNRVALDHPKTPKNVVLMENYHRLFAIFSRLKIASLDAERKEAKQKYQDYMQAYVAEQLGRPMEKLTMFFEGVEAQIGAGVMPEEVGYQIAFSKQELRRVIKEYPAREIKRGLDCLYRKVEKHLCDEENLLQVVWRSMQEEFLKQYKHFEEMIGKCYADCQITPEFTIDEVLRYFSEIAQSH